MVSVRLTSWASVPFSIQARRAQVLLALDQHGKWLWILHAKTPA